ncbi:hypothetical protein Btru_032556 [Bulinus truncatus]|nr:hypothetical protein Btru_032556 [Bulinus truncatus]
MSGRFVHLVTICLIVCLAVCIHTAASQEYCAINHWTNDIHPHPYDCDKYVQCSNGATTIVHCQVGKLYDPKIKACRDASMVTDRCNDAISTTPASTVSPADDFCRKNNWAAGIHPHPVYCDRFVQCHSFVTSITMCPSGQLFDIYSQICSQHAPPCNDATIPPTYATLVSQCVNDTQGDILFILDSSSSIGYDDYKKQLSFAANITNDFPVGPRNVQFSVLVFSVVAESAFPFDRYYRKDELRSVGSVLFFTLHYIT